MKLYQQVIICNNI